jgi:hypothetical protein
MALTIENTRMELQCYPMDVTLSDGSTGVSADEYVSHVAVGYTATDEDGVTAYVDGMVSLAAPESKDPATFTAFSSLQKSWGDAIAEQWRIDNGVDAKLISDVEIIRQRPKIVSSPWDTA